MIDLLLTTGEYLTYREWRDWLNKNELPHTILDSNVSIVNSDTKECYSVQALLPSYDGNPDFGVEGDVPVLVVNDANRTGESLTYIKVRDWMNRYASDDQLDANVSVNDFCIKENFLVIDLQPGHEYNYKGDVDIDMPILVINDSEYEEFLMKQNRE